MTENRISVSDSSILIQNLDVPGKDTADYLRRFEEEEHEDVVVEALQVGVFCLERCRLGQDVEFVRRQLEALLNGVLLAVRNVPATVEKQLIEKIGTDQGQVLAPVLQAVKLTSSAMGRARTGGQKAAFRRNRPEEHVVCYGKGARRY